ncbi:MAG: NUDIX hydrolase [Sedimentisphaerales bacterium]|nr:NUDIX hydrolase [Sedimentisphaerales bacterium]
MSGDYKIKKLTDCKWANLFEVTYKDKNGAERKWTVASRKDSPIAGAAQPDAVVIIPIIETPDGKRLVITKEWRVPIGDFEYGFPAGLIENGQSIEQAIKDELKQETGLDVVKIRHISKPVYSSPGLTDESCCMAIVEATGRVSDKFLEDSEDIETILMDVEDVKNLLDSDKKVSAKAWGILYSITQTCKIE